MDPKTFTNSKEMLDYLKSDKSKVGEVVILKEEATFSHPKRTQRFKKWK